MDTITKPSRRFAVLFRVVFYAYPVIMFCLWLWIDPAGSNDWLDFDLIESVMEGRTVTELLLWQRVACFGASMLTGGAVMYVFRRLSRLFDLYGEGVFFDAGTVTCYRGIGAGLIVQQLLSFPEQALQTLILSWKNPVGERFISFGVDDANISLIIVGLMIILISRIMDEGRKMQEEQQFTV